jgi:FkbM family methyltransferase
MVAIDVGANRGVYVFPLAARASHVYAYEPSPWLASYLARGVPSNVTVRPCAVSDKPGTVSLRVPIRADGSLSHNEGSIERYGTEGTRSAEVQCVRLDDENTGPVGFIKIDAEDHEIPVVRGARNIILRDRPNLLVEVLGFAQNPQWPALLAEIRALGYEGYALRDGALELASSLSNAQAAIGLNVVFLPIGGVGGG